MPKPPGFLIGSDIGTQGTKTTVFATDGRAVASAFQASKIRHPSPGAVEEDPEVQLASVCATIKKCLAGLDPGDVKGVAIAGQMAGIIGVGADGRAITPYDSWLDNRCTPQMKILQRKAGGEIIEKTGGPASFNHGPKILWWKKNRPAVYRKVRSFVQPGGYVAMRLCGLDTPFIDTTYLHFSGFADNRRSAWDHDLCRTFGVDEKKLPRIVPPHTVIGEVTPPMSRRCGLRPGTPVVAGCGDTAASFLACGAVRAGVCVDVAGTASVFAATTDRFIADRRTQTLACGQSAVPGLWHPYAYINGGGMNLEWFRNEFAGGRTLVELDRELPEPEEDFPMFVPHLGGRNNPSWPGLRGAWAGLTRDHGRAHLYYAVLESVALEYGLYRDVLRSLDRKFAMREIRVTGGGERSAAWNAIKAGVLGCPVVQMSRCEGASMGAALLAGLGVGVLPDLPKAAESWATAGTVTKPARAPFYTRRLRKYAGLLDHLHDWSQL
ncbi:MAG: xylulokinase [Terrimicrobiaceae bacterium]